MECTVSTVTLDQTIDMAMQLPFDQQEMLLEIIRKRQVEINRQTMAKDAETSIAMFQANRLKAFSANEIIAELRQA